MVVEELMLVAEEKLQQLAEHSSVEGKSTMH